MMRSMLFVPAKWNMLQKISRFHADGYIIDLEDSILSEEKDCALETVKNFLQSSETEERHFIIRINKERAEKEITELQEFPVAFMLPKFEAAADYSFMKRFEGKKEVLALIESPMGFVNLKEIAAENYITGLAFGAEDYSASVGMDNESALLQFPKSMIVMAAKAYKKAVYDTPSFAISDRDVFENEVKNARALGFDGKMAINPKQVEFINQTWRDADIETMMQIVEQYESMGEAVCVINGKVYEKMHIAHMKRKIKESGEI